MTGLVGHEAHTAQSGPVPFLVGTALLAAGYAVLAARARADARGWNGWRTTSFLAGAVVLAVAVVPSASPYPDGDFRGHVVQHLLIGMLAPMALALGAPVTLLLRSMPPRWGRVVGRVLRSPATHVMTHPVTVLLLNLGGLVALYTTPLYALTTGDEVAHHLVHLHFLVAGYLFAWVVAGADPAPRRPSVPARLVLLGIAIAVHATLSQLMYAGIGVLVPVPVAERRGGAEIMYYGGDIAELLLAFALVTTWRQRADRRAGQVSRGDAEGGRPPAPGVLRALRPARLIVPAPIVGRDSAVVIPRGGPLTGNVAAPSAQEVEQLRTDGIVGRQGAFSPEWADRLGEDIMTLFREALDAPGTAVGRGPNRYYVEIHPERLRGFVDLVTHPWVTGICEAVLGPDHQIVEVGFDVPLPGAVNQPWHRDFPSPPETTRDGRLTSLAFNLTTVDVTPEMGPFEIAPGTQWDDSPEFEHGMFPPKSHWPRYEALGRRRLTRRGDISARSALTIHRGTANRSTTPRPTLVLGVDAPGAGNDERHDLMVTRAYHARLPEPLLAHLPCRVVDELEPIEQKHTIEGLVMGAP